MVRTLRQPGGEAWVPELRSPTSSYVREPFGGRSRGPGQALSDSLAAISLETWSPN